MKKKLGAVIAAIALCLAMVASLAACGGGSSATTLELTNGLAYDFDHVFIAPHSDSEWGDDLLGENENIASGDSHTFTLGSASNDKWDICCVDTDGDYWYFYDVTIKGENAATVSSGPVLTFTNGSTVDGTFEFGSLSSVGGLLGGLTDSIQGAVDEIESGVAGAVDDVNAALGGGETQGAASGAPTADVFVANYNLTNTGTSALWWYYSSDTDSSQWGNDRLSGRVIHTDEDVDVTVESTSDNTLYDIRLRFEEEPYYIAQAVDFANVAAVTVNSETLTLDLFDASGASIGSVQLVAES